MRLDKFVCKSTELTRKEAILQIQQGRVTVNGAVEVSERTQVHENNRIMLEGALLT
ncbi:MAG: S4 domain-containing protein, partial [Oceanospirillum sp.]|nr:S4 domain-containing protein [Oceanospirillum sp.]